MEPQPVAGEALIPQIAVYGLGRLGLPLYNVLLRAGFSVVGVDPKLDKDWVVPAGMYWNTIEPDMMWTGDVLDRGTLSHKPASAGMSFIVVPTPTLDKGDRRGGFDYSKVSAALRTVASINEEGHTAVIISTLSPGTCHELSVQFHELNIVYSPTFIAIGSVVHDLTCPDMLLLGGDEQPCREVDGVWETVFQHFDTARSPFIHHGSFTEIELIKLSVNCFLGTKISLANSLGQLFTAYGVDQSAVNIVGRDHRIGTQYFMPGSPIAGPCLPRDNKALQTAAAKKGLNLPISVATDRVNFSIIEDFYNQVCERVNNHVGHRPHSVGILGMTYKYGVDLPDESAGTRLSQRLEASGVIVMKYDDMLSPDTLEKVLACDVVVVAQKEYEPVVSGFTGRVVKIWP